MAKLRIPKTKPHDSSGALVLWRKRSLWNSDGITPNSGTMCRRARPKLRFSTGREVSGSDALLPKSPSATVVRVHDGALAEEYALSSTTLVVVEVWWSQSRSSWQQQEWLYESLLMTHMAWHGRWAIVELIATSTNYSGSWTKCGGCWKYSSGWHGGSVCIICTIYRITCQLTESVARDSRR